MLSLLAPAALWLAPLLAAPLVLHFMGRKAPPPRDFPALPPVAASLQSAMRRHRVENRLLLLLRLLILLCLILAAAGPVWRDANKPAPPAVAALLMHNNVWGLLPEADEGDNGATGHRPAERLITVLDSLTDGRLVTESVLPETFGSATARHGDPAPAITRLLHRATEQAGGGAAHAFIPVFTTRDLAALATAARPWLTENPAARLVVIDRSHDVARLQAFDTVRHEVDADGLLTLRVTTRATIPPLWTPRSGGGPRPARLENGEAFVTMPLPDSGWVAGTFALASDDPVRALHAVHDVATAWRAPPAATLCHLDPAPGAAYVSRASLGAGGPRLRVAAYERRLPPEATCDLLYLADPRDADDALVARAAAVLRSGGILVLEAGPRFDPVFWNRRLLGPLEAGHFLGVITENVTARGDARALAAVGIPGAQTARWGAPGRVTRRFGFAPAPRASVLLSVAGSPDKQSPVLVHQELAGGGTLVIWTTSLTDPAWSDIGYGAWAPLMHQALFETNWRTHLEAANVHGDTILSLPGVSRVLAPGNLPFTRTRADADNAGLTVGPFDEPGLYRLCNRDCDSAATSSTSATLTGNGTSRVRPAGTPYSGWLAVNAAPAPRAPDATDWKAFDEALGAEAAARVIRLRNTDALTTIYSGVHLRFALLIAAALLLLAEGLVSLRAGKSRAPTDAATSPNQRN